MIDWHSHVLPKMDDGSRSTAESVAMIEMLGAQGVATVIATPHFYANDETVESFLARREKSFEALKSALSENAPEVILGAEVKYYQGISRMGKIKDLAISGSKLLLLEMPMSKWTEYVVRELIEMAGKNSVRIVLAHVERYFALQDRRVWKRLAESGILVQVNASFFNSLMTRRKALALLRDGAVHFVGSDCHNTMSRPPRIAKTFEIIKKKFGEDYINQMNDYWHFVLVE